MLTAKAMPRMAALDRAAAWEKAPHHRPVFQQQPGQAPHAPEHNRRHHEAEQTEGGVEVAVKVHLGHRLEQAHRQGTLEHVLVPCLGEALVQNAHPLQEPSQQNHQEYGQRGVDRKQKIFHEALPSCRRDSPGREVLYHRRARRATQIVSICISLTIHKPEREK